MVDADGSNLVQLTNGPDVDWEPWWSPDGTRLIFTTFRDGDGSLYTMNPDGTDKRRLTSELGAYCYPAWSNDGTRIAFTLGSDLSVMNADGSPIEGQEHRHIGPGTEPSWAPDDSRLVFARWVDENFEIFLADPDGTREVRLTDNAAPDLNPVWSPDGTQIAFSSFRDGNWEIYVMNVDGSAQTRITDDPATDFLPAWG